MTSATESSTTILRRLLNDRGVKYNESTQGNTTFFRFDYCDRCDDYVHTIAITGACISAYCEYLTPEQAIAATLGGGKLTAEQVCETVLNRGNVMGSRFYGDWQAIADELNATLGSGECEYVIEDNMNESEGTGDVWFRCTNCDMTYDYYADDWLMKQDYCPHCGAKIRKPVKR